jgi:hypothetical protein
MTLWNGHHGVDSAVVPSELIVSPLSPELSVVYFKKLNLNDLAFDVLVIQ